MSKNGVLSTNIKDNDNIKIIETKFENLTLSEENKEEDNKKLSEEKTRILKSLLLKPSLEELVIFIKENNDDLKLIMPNIKPSQTGFEYISNTLSLAAGDTLNEFNKIYVEIFSPSIIPKAFNTINDKVEELCNSHNREILFSPRFPKLKRTKNQEENNILESINLLLNTIKDKKIDLTFFDPVFKLSCYDSLSNLVAKHFTIPQCEELIKYCESKELKTCLENFKETKIKKIKTKVIDDYTYKISTINNFKDLLKHLTNELIIEDNSRRYELNLQEINKKISLINALMFNTFLNQKQKNYLQLFIHSKINIEPIVLKNIEKNTVQYKILFEFCKLENSTENISLLSDLNCYIKNLNKQVKLTEEDSKFLQKIWDEYIQTKSKNEINMSATESRIVFEKMLDDVLKGSSTPNDVIKVLEELKNVLAFNLYDSFLRFSPKNPTLVCFFHKDPLISYILSNNNDIENLKYYLTTNSNEINIIKNNYNRIFVLYKKPNNLCNENMKHIYLIKNDKNEVIAHYYNGGKWSEISKTQDELKNAKINFSELSESKELIEPEDIKKITSFYGIPHIEFSPYSLAEIKEDDNILDLFNEYTNIKSPHRKNSNTPYYYKKN
jgi:hypothetical protein